MKLWKFNTLTKESISFKHIWWIPAIFPLFLVLYEFVVGVWGWGLMDDHNMVQTPGNVWERFIQYHNSLLPAGRFYPTFLFHCALFYKVFSSSPLAFFIFRFIEVVLALGLWAYLSFKVTHNKFAAAIFMAVALSFYKFYDSFFFLSVQEILGILFCGAAAICFLNVINSKNSYWPAALGGLLFLLLAFTSKEPFVAVGMAMGFSIAVVGIIDQKRRGLIILGAGLFLLSLGYAIFLKTFIAKEYSGRYVNSGWEQIIYNLGEWVKKDFLNHLPWLVMLSSSLFFRRKTPKWNIEKWWGLAFGISAYVLYTLIILPWSAWGHYVIPLGVFFAFIMAVIFTDILNSLRPAIVMMMVIAGLAVNVTIGGQAISFHSTYQRDTKNLLVWLAQNSLFDHEVSNGAMVMCNAEEPAAAIPNLLRLNYGKSYANFIAQGQVSVILKDKKTKYYLWGTTMGDQDLRRLGEMWTPMFVSDHWIMFRRMI